MIEIDWPYTLQIAIANAIAVLVSTRGAGVITKSITDKFHRRLELDYGGDYNPKERVNWIGSNIGYIERALITILVIWMPSAVGSTITAVVAVKAASGWGAIGQAHPAGRARYFVIFMGTMISCTLAVICGLVTASLLGKLED